MFYLGTFNYTLDAKGRLFIPARFRENIGDEFVLFKSPDRCISIYDNANFEKLVEQVQRDSNTSEGRERQRTFFSAALTVTQDKQGRFTMPQDFIDFAGLGSEVSIVGEANRLEIWNRQTHEARNTAAVTAADYPQIYY